MFSWFNLNNAKQKNLGGLCVYVKHIDASFKTL